MNKRTISIITGISYLIIFFAAIFANFFVLDSILKNPVSTIENSNLIVRFGIIAFLITVICDIIVAWGLYELYKKHPLTNLSTYFRLTHAIIFGVGIFALPLTLAMSSAQEILHQANVFNTIWLIGLFFFGIHLILLSRIFQKQKIISILLTLAGIMYVLDTCAHFLMPNYASYASIFLGLVAVPSILGEFSFSIWLLFKGEK